MAKSPQRASRPFSFAHFLGHARADDAPEKDREDEDARKARRAEEDDRRKEEDARRAEEDDRRKDEDARRADEEKKDEDARKAKSDAEDGDCAKCDGEGTDGDGKDCDACDGTGKAAGKTSGKADDAPKKDDDKKDDDQKEEAKGRAAERARWASVLSDPISAAHTGVACTLLNDTDMPAASVLAALKTLPAHSRGRSLDERMARVVIPNPGSGGPAPGGPVDENAAFAAQVIEAGKRRRGEIT